MATTSYQRIAARNRVLEAALALQSCTAPEASPARALLKNRLLEAVTEHDEVVGKTSLGAAIAKALAAGNQGSPVGSEVQKVARQDTVEGAISKALQSPASSRASKNRIASPTFGKDGSEDGSGAPNGITRDSTDRMRALRKSILAEAEAANERRRNR
jgi:hypothetical protein